MRTQSIDTSIDAERVLISMIREASVSKRFEFIQSWATLMIEAGRQDVQRLHPEANDEEVRFLFIERQYGKHLADKLRMVLHTRGIQSEGIPEFQAAVIPCIGALEALHVPYALAGSLASSLYGMQRATLQVDVIADLQAVHSPALLNRLRGVYLFQEEEVDTAIRQKLPFTLVHLASLLKVVVTLAEQRIRSQQVFHRTRQITLVEGSRPISVLSPELVILSLLEAFKRSHQRADDLWYDLLGVLKVQSTDLDVAFLEQQAVVLDIADLLKRALVDSGLRDE